MRKVLGVCLLAVALSGLLSLVPEAQAASKPRVRIAVKPAVVAPGARAVVSGRVVGRVPKPVKALRLRLQRRSANRWRTAASGRLSRTARFAVKWRAPVNAGGLRLRVRLMLGKRVLATSQAWRVIVRRSAPSPPGGAPGSGSGSAGPSPAGPVPPQTSYVARPGTVVMSAEDVVSAGPGTVTLAEGVTPPKVGGHVFGRVEKEDASFLGRVDAVDWVGGRPVLQVTPAPLSDGFSDFDEEYDGPITLASGDGSPSRSVQRALSASVPLGGKEFFECNGGVDVPAVTGWSLNLEDATTHFDLDLGSRSLDFSTKGRLVAKLNLTAGKGTLTCELSDALLKKLPRFPVVIGNFQLTFGPAASLTASGASTPTELSATARFAAGFSYIDGSTSSLHAVGLGGTAESGPPSLEMKAGVKAKLGLNDLIENATPIDPSASVTAGAKLALAPPEGDGQEGELRGPRCIDLTASGVVDVGVNVAVSFFPDISLEVPAYETPKLALYKGRCYGYEGTVTVRQHSRDEPVPGHSPGYETDNTATITMDATKPARYGLNSGNGLTGTVMQPYTWTASTHDAGLSYTSEGVTCEYYRYNHSGAGRRPGPGEIAGEYPAWPLIFDENGFGTSEWRLDGLTGHGSHTCPDAPDSDPTGVVVVTGRTGYVTGQNPMTLDQLTGTVDEGTATTTYDLQRVEVDR
jgi:hypothetical protein